MAEELSILLYPLGKALGIIPSMPVGNIEGNSVVEIRDKQVQYKTDLHH